MKTSLRFVHLLEKIFPHRSKLAKLSKSPVVSKLFYKMIFNKNNLTVIPKDNVVEIKLNKKIDPPDSVVVPSDIVHKFIDEANHHFLMNFCICKEAMQCKNHPIEYGCLFMGDAVLEINKDFGRLVSKEEAHEHIRKCREDGLVHLIGSDKLDEQWLGVSDGLKLLTVCNCCECCCLWRMLPDLDSKLSSTVKKMPGVSIEVTSDCVGCGKCTEDICFVDAIKVENGKAVISDECRICGRCAEVCPNNAIKIKVTDDKFIDKTASRIKKTVKIK